MPDRNTKLLASGLEAEVDLGIMEGGLAVPLWLNTSLPWPSVMRLPLLLLLLLIVAAAVARSMNPVRSEFVSRKLSLPSPWKDT